MSVREFSSGGGDGTKTWTARLLDAPGGQLLVGLVGLAVIGVGVALLVIAWREKYLKHRRPGESVTDAVLREKRREEAIARATGWRCIRITWADLQRPKATAAMIRAVLAGAAVHA